LALHSISCLYRSYILRIMGNSDSIDFSLSNLYKSWCNFRRGKRSSREIITFQYSLEPNLFQMQKQLEDKNYRHGNYAYYTVQDSKRREIAVAGVHDRVIHRLLYDYLLPMWDKHFIFDAWSCRPNKGLHVAVARSQDYMQANPRAWVWRADIIKFFDSVDQEVLMQVIKRRVKCADALWLIESIISSYYKNQPGLGMPIGNLTSQIFANIYLNEFDRFISYKITPPPRLDI
jgi:RNA-directed DNA polymerase